MSDLETLQKNLQYKIKASEIGLNSWKGQHGTVQPMFIPTKDYLLNTASKQQDQIQKRNEMMEEYLEEQRTPIYRYDEYGNVITDIDGKPREFRYHAIPPPDLNLTTLTGTIYDPVADHMQNINLSDAGQRSFLEEKDNIIARVNTELDGRIRDYKRDDNNLKRELIGIEEQIEKDEEEIKRLYEVENLPNRKKIVKNLKNRQRFLLKDKKSIIDTIEENKEIIFNLLKNKERVMDDINDLSAQIKNKLKENEQKVKTYQDELTALNTGQLKTFKNFNETDEEYLERLQRLGDMEFADRRTEEKALIREKQKLRENLKLIVRNNAVIDQVVNTLYANEPLDLNDLNKYFAGFQDYFIKKFGNNNEKVIANDILTEITLYLQRVTDPTLLQGYSKVIPTKIPASGYESESDEEPLSISSSLLRKGPLRSRRSSIASESDLILPSSQEGVEEYTSGDPIPPLEQGLQYRLHNDNQVLELYNSTNPAHIFIRVISETPEFTTSRGSGGVPHKIKKRNKPTFFISPSGSPQSFRQISSNAILSMITHSIDVDKSDVCALLQLPTRTKLTADEINNAFRDLGLRYTTDSPVFVSTTPNQTTHIPLLGLGIKKSDDIPEKVQFGKNILLLKKLYLKNILSLQNIHHVKINGFQNTPVSDNLVKIIMNLVNGHNFTPNQLNELSGKERVLLDNLLVLSELNKKFVTGSSTDSLNKLKKEYDILIGEIEAGNNNDLLKKKLYNLLMRFVHFGSLGMPYAMKHYKEIIKNYF